MIKKHDKETQKPANVQFFYLFCILNKLSNQ